MSNIWHSCDTALKNKSNVEINYQINQIELSINQTNQTTKPENLYDRINYPIFICIAVMKFNIT